MIHFNILIEQVRSYSPSYGVPPYHLKALFTDDMRTLSIQHPDPHVSYIGVYIWESYNKEDLLHYLKHSKEYFQMPEYCRPEFIKFQLKRLSNDSELNEWKVNQTAIAIGIIMGSCKKMGLKATVIDMQDEPTTYLPNTSIYCFIKVHK